MSKLAPISRNVMPPNCAKCGAVCLVALIVTDESGAKIKVCIDCSSKMPHPVSQPWKPGKPSRSIQG